jgi:hypothetical protein
MLKLRTFYYYLFYKFYKLSEAAPSRWWSEGKAGGAMTILAIFFVFTVAGYVMVFTKKDILPDDGWWIIIGVGGGIGLLNYFIFAHNNQWREIINQFDSLPKKQQQYGSLLFWFILIGCLLNLIIMFYLMSQVDWQGMK